MKTSRVLGLTAALLAIPALAVEPTPGAALGTDAAEIARALAESGYEMSKYEREGDRIEVYAVRRGERTEVYVDARTGRVVKIESESGSGGSSEVRTVPTTDDGQIRTALAARGYDVVEIERKRHEIEVYANRDGRRWELELDPVTGDIRSVKAED